MGLAVSTTGPHQHPALQSHRQIALPDFNRRIIGYLLSVHYILVGVGHHASYTCL